MDDLKGKLISKPASDLSSEDLRRLRDNPRLLDLLNERETVKLRLMWRVLALAVLLVAGSKLISETYGDQISQFLNNVVVDLIFEMGAALIGSVATVVFIEYQQKRQFEENLRHRSEIEQRIAQLEDPEVPHDD